MTALSAEQQAVVDAPLTPLSVIACAGSGKTRTAVHRLVEVRKRMGDQRGRVALLSFSNVAVDTFRKHYQVLAQELPAGVGRSRVEIDTIDAFITANVLRPHAYRTMDCSSTPFLISGAESFLQNKEFKFWAQPSSGASFPVQPEKLKNVMVRLNGEQPVFEYANYGSLLPVTNGSAVANRLGKIGAYTHALGQYWTYQVLRAQPKILSALAHRYPHILVDESQDIGSLHQAILELLAGAGVQISLIGDPHQGIYEFAGADGVFLTEYRERAQVTEYPLTRNYRSVPAILTIANTLSARTDTAERASPETHHGAFFVAYRNDERQQLVDAFRTAVVAANLEPENSAILCRSRPLADELAGVDAPVGQGLVKGFARAAVLRDKRQDYLSSFKTVAGCVFALLDNPPQGLLTKITQPARYPEMRALRREIWNFTRNVTTGLPQSDLIADTQWHPQLLVRVNELLDRLHAKFGFTAAGKLGHKLAKKSLPNAPLMAADDLVVQQNSQIRVDTVHQAKGESLDAVLYMATKEHVQALLAGTSSEVGRIGYVAITRAKNLLWLGVPANSLKELKPALLAAGFHEVGAAVTNQA
jgi:superfamily I DNA/RNA helicase